MYNVDEFGYLLIAEHHLHRPRNRDIIPQNIKKHQTNITKTINNPPNIHKNRGPEALPEALQLLQHLQSTYVPR